MVPEHTDIEDETRILAEDEAGRADLPEEGFAGVYVPDRDPESGWR